MIRRHLMALRVGLMVGRRIRAVGVFLITAFRFRDGDPAELWRAPASTSGGGSRVRAHVGDGPVDVSGLYRIDVRWRTWTEVRDIARATLLVLAITLSSLFLIKQQDVSRLFLGLLFLTQPTVTLLGRMVLRSTFEFIRRRGHDARYMVVAGTGRLAQDFADRVESHPGLGLQIVGPPVGAR